MNEFIGHLHPVLVHLPIGILMLACAFHIASYHQKFTHFKTVMSVMLFWGMVCAVLSCITGYVLSTSGDYNPTLVGWHKWMGITVASVALILYVLFQKIKSQLLLRSISGALLVLIMITGHLGGSLTHGSDYLSLSAAAAPTIKIKPIPNVQQAVTYTDLVQPILQNKCYSCHGEEKQKGKLRLDLQTAMLKGGKNGPALIPGNADNSEMIKRMMLDAGNDNHMPPKEKPQLTDNEIALIHWWINTGADFTKKVNQLKQSNDIKPVLASFQSGAAATAQPARISDIPTQEVKPADGDAIKHLKENGIVILPVSTGNNYLSANFINAGSLTDTVLKNLDKISKQLVWLRMDNPEVTDNTLKHVSKMEQLTRLHLNGTKITDAGLAQLTKLNKLQSLSLVGTAVTAKGVAQLKSLKSLRNIYLYQTQVGKADWAMLKKTFPKANIDSGNYQVPTFATDTQEVKAPEKKAE